MNYSKKALLNLLIEFFEKNNRCPMPKDFRKKEYNQNIYIEKFGSWKEALNQAGILGKGFKTCSKCHTEYPATADYFNRESETPDGLNSHCKNCRSKVRKEKYIEDKASGKSQQYYKQNKLRHITSSIKNRGYPNLTQEQLQKILNNFKNKDGISICPYCGREMIEDDMIHFDHFYPYSSAYGNQPLINLIPVCRYCNRSKQDEEFSYWYHYQFFYNPIREQELINYITSRQLIPFYKLN